jgi:hypothetical protein
MGLVQAADLHLLEPARRALGHLDGGFGKPEGLGQQGLSAAGAVAQLVERLVRNEEVSGSTPLGSTIPPAGGSMLPARTSPMVVRSSPPPETF